MWFTLSVAPGATLLTAVSRFAKLVRMELKAYLASEGHGAASGLSRALGVAPSLVSQWASGDRPVPVDRCVAIERATNGAVTRRDLRPDDWQLIWPELAEPERVA